MSIASDKKKVFGYSGNVTCRYCGWVHFPVSRKYAIHQVAEFNSYYYAQKPEVQECFGRPGSIDQYEKCMFCGAPWTNFRKSKRGDCPPGCTLNPILHYTEE